MVSWRRLFSMALALGTLAACSKAPENAAPAAPVAAPVAAPAVSAAPAQSAAAAEAAPATTAAPAATAPATSHDENASAKPKGAAHTKPAATSAAHGTAPADGPKKVDCGEKGQPTCPLQGFMKSQMATAAASGDGALMAKALDEVAGHAPPGLANWSAIAKGGAAKARAGDIDGAKASCKACHDQYKARYKAEMRDRAW